MRAIRHGVWMLALLASVGCGPSVPQEELDRAREAVEKSLEAWKRGEPPGSLKALSPSIQFTDDEWSRGSKLLDFAFKNVEGKPGSPLRCTVLLTLKDRHGRTVEKENVYEVKLGPPVVIARDPYF